MDLIKRFGTQKKKFKLQFFIGKLKLSTFIPGKVYIVLRRGNHKVKSQQKLQMPQDCKINFNKQILQLEVTLYFDEKENKYQEKPGQMDIVMIDSKGGKILVGIISFDVGQYANVGQESMKEKKQIQQTPKGFSGLLEYNVFIKYIGQGSESSLDKVADFFFGKSKQAESEKKINDISSKQKIQGDLKEGSRKQLPKTQAKKDTNVDFYEIDQPKQRKQKNYVTTGKARQGSRQFVEDNQQLAKNFYLDDTEQNLNQEKKSKKNKQKSNSVQKKRGNDRDQVDSQKIIAYRQSDKKQEKKQKQKAQKQTPDPMTYYALEKQIQSLKAELGEYKKNYEQLKYKYLEQQHESKMMSAQYRKVQKQIAQCKEEIRQKNEQLEEQKAFQRRKNLSGDEEMTNKLEQLQKQLKRVQKEKNQIIVQNSKLKQKYKQDFKKYQQLLQQKQSSQQSKTDSAKADLHKLKEQCSFHRQTIQKLTKQKNDKHQQLIKQKHQNKLIQEQLTEVKTSLSKIKLKICNKLNQVLVKDELGIVDILMDLNKDD